MRFQWREQYPHGSLLFPSLGREALKKTELRRKQRNIAVHLSKNFGIETSTDKPVEGVKGKRSAYMVALDTRLNPVGGPKMRREVDGA